MQARSAAFDRAVRLGARGVCQVDGYFGGLPTVEGLPVLSGAVLLSLTGQARRALRCSIIDERHRWSRSPDGPLTPWGNELRVRTGFEVAPQWGAPAVPELLEQGRFRIVRVNRSLPGVTTITAIDRSFVVAGASFEYAYQIAANADRAAAVAGIITRCFGGAVLDPAPPMAPVPARTIFEEGARSGDPWRNAQDLCSSDGKDLYVSPLGTFRIAPRPDPLTAPVWTYQPGPGQLLVDAEEVLDLVPVRNVWHVEAQGGDNAWPAVASAEITDPLSPINPGRVGRRPEWFTDSLAILPAQLQAQADYYKLVDGGRHEGVTFTARPHPALEPGDVVAVKEPVSGLDVACVAAEWELDLFSAAPSVVHTLGRVVR